MLHHRQRLPLGVEPRDDVTTVHSGLEDLEGHAPAHGRVLLRQVNLRETALADLLQDPVGSDLPIGFRDRGTLPGNFDGRTGHVLLPEVVGIEQSPQDLTKSGVPAAARLEASLTLLGRKIAQFEKDLLRGCHWRSASILPREI
jgi:hypothetical protein